MGAKAEANKSGNNSGNKNGNNSSNNKSRSKKKSRPDIETNASGGRREAGVSLDSALGVDAQAFVDTWGQIFSTSLQQPNAALNANRDLVAELFSILTGNSELSPAADDRRFADAAWFENPLFKRLGQGYLAWARSLDNWLDASGLEGMQYERARFVLDAAKDILAPMNTLLGNPEALRQARETRGQSVMQGIRNLLDDLRHNHGYPAAADRHAFKVGKDVAATPGAVVFRNELFELIQYQPATDTVVDAPLLYVFSQVNRFYLGDLTPDRSMFKKLLNAGIPVFAVSWRNPQVEHRDWNLDTYAEGVIHAISVMRDVTGADKVNLMGLCAGGLTAAAAAGALQARGDDWVNTLSLFVNVLDNRPEDSDFGLFVSERSVQAQKQMTRVQGLFNEKNVFEMFAMLRWEENVMGFLRSNYLLGEEPLKHPLLFWSIDYTRLPAGLHSAFLDLSLDNKLAKRDMRVLGQRVDLSKIDYPVYIMAGSTDHITPWKACYRSTQLFDTDLLFVLTNQNHTQTISSRDDNKHLKHWIGSRYPKDPEKWLDQVEEHDGSWIPHWIDWLREKSPAEEIAAPTEFGGKNYPEIDPAPGRYVLEK
ncbi:MAG: alpha/beta fold hydrolase [Pseudomonadota bacterium]